MFTQFDWLARNSSSENIHKSVKLRKNKYGFGIVFDDEKIIRQIEENGAAYYSGLELGDKIMCINGFECQSVDDIKRFASNQSSIILSVSRN